jgi:hypothetical protein
MSAQIAPAEHVCYVHCNFCNTILAVIYPISLSSLSLMIHEEIYRERLVELIL